MKKRYAWHADVLDISSRMHNFDVFLMADAYWRFNVNSFGHHRRREQRNKMLYQRSNKARRLYIHLSVILKKSEEPIGHSCDLSQYYRDEREIRKNCRELRENPDVRNKGILTLARDQTGRSDELWLQWL